MDKLGQAIQQVSMTYLPTRSSDMLIHGRAEGTVPFGIGRVSSGQCAIDCIQGSATPTRAQPYFSDFKSEYPSEYSGLKLENPQPMHQHYEWRICSGEFRSEPMPEFRHRALHEFRSLNKWFQW
ncbi:hypothetical protein LX59_02961 [Azomonas agilis]|uniref:Uncharacterized protein n=1 Tax=Azomonas agilis TaxID=116849 RepID=A0A562HZQ1_9GAMM|nr:hypothetical protein LX59_02961 [Azomonas agilis]